MADLITLNRAKMSLPNVTSADDSKIAAMISSASKAIESHLNRSILSASRDERHDGDGSGVLQLRHFPVTLVTRIAAARSSALRITNTSSSNQRATVSVTSTGLRFVSVASGVATTDTSITWASNVTVQAVANAVDALGNGWDAEVLGDFALWPSADLVAIQGALSVAGSSHAELQLYDDELTDVVVNDETGELIGYFPKGQQNIRVQYTAGYAVTPEDIQEACAQLVAHFWNLSKRDGALDAERLGDYSYQLADPEKYGYAIPNGVRRLLAPYLEVLV